MSIQFQRLKELKFNPEYACKMDRVKGKRGGFMAETLRKGPHGFVGEKVCEILDLV